MQITNKMKDAAVVLANTTGFSITSWVVFYPTNDGEGGWDCEIASDHAKALEFYREMKSPDNYGDAAMIALASCY